METCWVGAQKSADGIVVQNLGRRPERGKEEGHSISFGTAMNSGVSEASEYDLAPHSGNRAPTSASGELNPTGRAASGRVVERQPTRRTTVEAVVSSENMQRA